MSFTMIVEAFDTVINVQMINLLNLFKDAPVIQRDVTYTSLMATLNNPGMAWPLKVDKITLALRQLLSPFPVKEFLSSKFEAAKLMLRPESMRSLPPRLLQVALLLRLKQGIQESVGDAQEKIRNRSDLLKKINILQKRIESVTVLTTSGDMLERDAEVKKTELNRAIESLREDIGVEIIEESLKTAVLLRLGKTQELNISCVHNARPDDEFCAFLNVSGNLLMQSFKSLFDHHAVEPIFLDIDSSVEMPFVELSRRFLFVYLLLAQLPDWGFKEVRHGENGKISAIQLIPEGAEWRKTLQAPDIAQHKILAALGIFACIHALFSNPVQYQKYSTEIAKSVMGACIVFAKETRSQYTLSAILGTVQRLDALLGVLQAACDEQFSPCQIELIKPQHALIASGWWEFGGKVLSGVTAMLGSSAPVSAEGGGFPQSPLLRDGLELERVSPLLLSGRSRTVSMVADGEKDRSKASVVPE